jgi:O-antigen/teichoic acid export membrane protein
MTDTAVSGRSGRIGRLFHAFDGLLGDTLWSGLHDGFMLIQALTSFTLLQRSLEEVDYGSYVGAWGLIGAISATTSGVGLALLQRTVGERDDPDQALRSFLSLMLVVTSIGSAVLLAIAVATIDLPPIALATMVVAELIVIGTITVVGYLVQAVAGFPAAARVRMTIIVIRFIVLLSLFTTGNLTIPNLMAGHLLGFLVYATYLITVHLPRYGFTVRLGRPSGVAARSTGMFAVPMAASKIQTEIDKYFVLSFGPEIDAALYGAAYRILLLGIAPLTALDAAAFQRFLPQDDHQQRLHWRRATRLGGFMVASSTLLAIVLYLAMPLVERILLEERYREAASIVPWLLLLIPVIATTNGPMNGLLGLGRADIRMRVYLLAAVVAVVCYVVLIPLYSWRGAVAGTFVSEIFLSVTAWSALWVYQRKADQVIWRAAYLPRRYSTR